METRKEIIEKKNQEQRKLIKEALESDFKAILSSLSEVNAHEPASMSKDQAEAFIILNKNVKNLANGIKETNKIMLNIQKTNSAILDNQKKDKMMLVIAALIILNFIMLFYIIFSSL